MRQKGGPLELEWGGGGGEEGEELHMLYYMEGGLHVEGGYSIYQKYNCICSNYMPPILSLVIPNC